MDLRSRAREFIHHPPGRRFASLHADPNRRSNLFQRGFGIIGGLVCVVLGTVMLVTPGPGILMLAVGGVLLAQTSPQLAQAFDSAELWLRRRLRIGGRKRGG
jgi:hypothetical protein